MVHILCALPTTRIHFIFESTNVNWAIESLLCLLIGLSTTETETVERFKCNEFSFSQFSVKDVVLDQ